MVHVATHAPPPEPRIPLINVRLADGLALPMKLMLPRDLLSGPESADDFVILGFGDVVVPALLVYLALRLDRLKETHTCASEEALCATKDDDALPASRPYFHAAMWGYTVGLAVTALCLQIFRVAQPALLYLVPCTTGALVYRAVVGKDLTRLWSGLPCESSTRSQNRNDDSVA
eukprot:TRINITY_DN70927_c0_g1_i1.p1 TRINITY_DN70927_c0_g1~~TRINITY_DN70927_c0_g1_i1.p1  ORF type:complete len:174 (-),score=21.27 TRINITY_DN70927_c0_g1_i1:7-528(-)